MITFALFLAAVRNPLNGYRVCTDWSESAQHGKEAITVCQLLAQQAGIFGFHVPVDRAVVADFDRLAAILAAETPEWPSGERQASPRE